ncbi:GtrA family protein [Pseudomonas sp. B22129]|uniref:GtrA family protein n=1 Tax=Pseudomonas sp. B22129 TaxID=3235111 RepID=UPI003784E485
MTFDSRFTLYISNMPNTLKLFARHLSAGAVATLTHFIVFAGLLPHQNATRSTFCAGIAGALVAYGLARHWVFAKRPCSDLRFVINATGQVASNTLIVTVLVDWYAHPYFAQTVATAVVTLQGFIINHLWVFQHDTPRDPFT